MNEQQNEQQFGNRVRQVLNRGLVGVDSETAQRLKAARELALSRQRREPAPALAWADHVLGGGVRGWPGLALYAVVSLAILLAGAAGIYNWQQSQRIAELEEIDSQLLTDDLPIDAYLDRGFQNWLKRRSAEQ
jgi:Protein of unknown function (DUF3619)